MNIFLIGAKGSGKTTLGRQIAGKLNLQFIDVDDYIEQKTGKSVPNLYNEEGEIEFRKKECEAIKEIMNSDNLIIATGGGTPAFCDNMNLMNKNGTSIYFKVSANELAKRIKANSPDRPLVKDKTAEQIKDLIISLNKDREPFYQMAHIIMENDNIVPDDVIQALRDYLREGTLKVQ